MAEQQKQPPNTLPTKPQFPAGPGGLKNPTTQMVLLSFVLPLVAWLAAAIVNPTGWPVADISMVVMLFIVVCMAYWPIALVIVALSILGAIVYKKRAWRLIAALFLLISFVYSVYFYTIASQADDHEFTG